MEALTQSYERRRTTGHIQKESISAQIEEHRELLLRTRAQMGARPFQTGMLTTAATSPAILFPALLDTLILCLPSPPSTVQLDDTDNRALL